MSAHRGRDRRPPREALRRATVDGLRHGYHFVALLRDRMMRRGVPFDAATCAAQTMLDPWRDAIGERREGTAYTLRKAGAS